MAISKKDLEEIISNVLTSTEEYWIDVKGNIFALREDGISIAGYSVSEIMGKHFSLLYPDEAIQQQQPEKDINCAIKVGKFETNGIRIKKNKIKFLAKIKYEMMTTQNERVGIRMTLQDTTYKVIQNHTIKKLASQYDSLFHNRFIGVLIVRETNLMILTANMKACDILGDQHIEKKYFQTYLKEKDSIDKFNGLIASRKADDIEVQLTKSMGNNCWVCMRCSQCSDGMIEILLFDITSEKKRIDELERLNNHLDQFIYHASHDLRSPLTTLLGLLQLAKATNSLDLIQSYVGLMTERTLHLDSLLTDLTSIAFNEKASLDLGVIDFEAEANPILYEYGQLNKSIACDLNVLQEVEFVTDIKRLRSILRNLVANSIKYYNPAQQSPFVSMSFIVDTNKVIIEVQDNGIGIDPQYTEKVFAMFFRGTNRSSGSGLGLYIVKAMVDKLDGEIILTSLPEEGSTFRIIIPNKKSDLSKPITFS